MSLTVTQSDIESVAPTLNVIPAQINPGGPVPVYFNDVLVGGVATLTLVGSRYAAGLAARVVALPAGASKFTLTYQINPSQLAALNSGSDEFDAMFVGPDGTRYNGSVRKNNDGGGDWEIVNAGGGWVPVGYKPGPFKPGVWATVTVVFQINWAAKTLSVVSVTDTGFSPSAFMISTALGGVPGTPNSGWEPNIIQLQRQGTLSQNIPVGVIASYTQDMQAISISAQ